MQAIAKWAWDGVGERAGVRAPDTRDRGRRRKNNIKQYLFKDKYLIF